MPPSCAASGSSVCWSYGGRGRGVDRARRLPLDRGLGGPGRRTASHGSRSGRGASSSTRRTARRSGTATGPTWWRWRRSSGRFSPTAGTASSWSSSNATIAGATASSWPRTTPTRPEAFIRGRAGSHGLRTRWPRPAVSRLLTVAIVAAFARHVDAAAPVGRPRHPLLSRTPAPDIGRRTRRLGREERPACRQRQTAASGQRGAPQVVERQLGGLVPAALRAVLDVAPRTQQPRPLRVRA